MNEVASLETVSFDIRTTRKALGISQKALAQLLGVSQPTIARLESDIKELNPSYQMVFNVTDALNSLGRAKSKELMMNRMAKDIMHRNVLFARPNESLAKAMQTIKEHDFLQLPVMNEKHAAVGTVYQKDLLEIATQRPGSISRMKVSDVMSASLPQVDKDTEVTKLKSILGSWNALLVVEKNRVIGIVTIYDILKLV